MGVKTGIQWTDSTWNPVRGCTRVSEGCRHCYAEIMAARFSQPGQWGEGFAHIVGGDHRWTGKVELVERQLHLPLSWREPRRIFVNSTSDLFHEALPDEAIDKVFAIMALCPQHVFQVLTKRPSRMRAYAAQWFERVAVSTETLRHPCGTTERLGNFFDWSTLPRVLPNVWLGTSVEDQATANERIPHLLAAPAAIRFLSCEPLLGPIDLYNGDPDPRLGGLRAKHTFIGDWWEPGDNPKGPSRHGVDWVIAGGESGPGARPMHPDWARSLRDQCAAAGVPFFFKQVGEWAWSGSWMLDQEIDVAGATIVTKPNQLLIESGSRAGRTLVTRVGKAKAGRLLDGIEHNAFPAAGGT